MGTLYDCNFTIFASNLHKIVKVIDNERLKSVICGSWDFNPKKNEKFIHAEFKGKISYNDTFTISNNLRML